MNPTIHNQLKNHFPAASLFAIVARVKVEASTSELRDRLIQLSSNLISNYTLENFREQENIKVSREAFKIFGRDPNRYMVSSEALYKRILQKKDLYYINNVIEINNFLSLKSGLSFGSYNLDNIKGEINYRIGSSGETLDGIGKGKIPLECLPVLCDEISPFGSPTSDSRRAMIDLPCENVLMIAYCFQANYNFTEIIEDAKSLLSKYASATEVKIL